MTTIPPWSYSALSTFENCPKQYYHRYILREKEPETEVTKHGTAVHKALEDRLRDHVKKPLPDAYATYEKLAGGVEKAAEGGLLMVELPLALDKSFQPCHFFGKEVWGRGKADVCILKGKKLWTGDWKTGKVREKIFQLQIFAAFLFKMFPLVDEIHANNLWLQANKIGENYKFTRAGESSIWQEILHKIGRVELAAEKDSFEPKQSGLCGFCSVKTCPHNRA